ncbi:MAG: type II toxin-antitoxin system RelE/ParE family toxin [Candidatus Electrothrix sp. AUS4]|nr:type II toxin-antitoxin system RelE/ParE family toxin [Candidatus Electrothrix sp. AUS4]
MDTEVILLDGVEAFLETLPKKLEAKAYWTMALLQKKGATLRQPYCKSVKGYTGLSELRVKFASDIVRLFYFEYNQKTYIITSGYVKKQQKLNKQEIKRAHRLMLQYIEEYSDDQT